MDFRTFANSSKTFSTIIFSTEEGRNFSKFLFVKQYEALVDTARCLYLADSKKVRSPFFAFAIILIFFMKLFCLNFKFGKSLLILINFFQKN